MAFTRYRDAIEERKNFLRAAAALLDMNIQLFDNPAKSRGAGCVASGTITGQS